MKNLSTEQRHAIFIREFSRHGNGMKAALTAGYSPTRAKVSACELLKNPEIQPILPTSGYFSEIAPRRILSNKSSYCSVTLSWGNF
jgi:hypothetical protein